MAELNTKGYSGKRIVRAMLVTTNDPSAPDIRLELSGNVKSRAYISTDTIRLTGRAGDDVKGELEITPTPDNPFIITAVTAEKGTDIRFELTQTDPGEPKKYRLTVYNAKKEKGWYIDKLHVKTDSRISPEFFISILGVIRGGS